jgi:catalase-peroxidase
VLTTCPTLSNEFVVQPLSLDTTWRPAGDGTYEAVFGSNSWLRALGEVYASDDPRDSSCTTSSPRWVKVMDLSKR